MLSAVVFNFPAAVSVSNSLLLLPLLLGAAIRARRVAAAASGIAGSNSNNSSNSVHGSNMQLLVLLRRLLQTIDLFDIISWLDL